MKGIILLITALLISHTALFGQWENLNEGIKEGLITIDFINENIGWIAGSDGLLFETKDGGQTWYLIPIENKWSITMIDFINVSIGWAIAYDSGGYTESIMKTSNGGQSWSIQKILEDIDLISIYAVDENVVYVAGYQCQNNCSAKIFKTTDGGANWTEISPQNSKRVIESIWFSNSQIGIATGFFQSSDTAKSAIVWSTNDGGMTWEEKIIPELSWISDLQFIDDSTGYFLAEVKKTTRSTIPCKTTDRFRSWSIVVKNDADLQMRSYFYNGNGHFCSIIQKGVFGIGVWGMVNSRCYILRSIDDGNTWEQKLPEGPWNLNKIYFCTDKVGFCLGGGTLLRSIDGGENWIKQKFSYSFEDVCFINKERGFASGGWLYIHLFGCGDMFTTKDGGKNWEPILSIGQKIEACFFINQLIGFILSRVIGEESHIYKTIDGGISWNYFSTTSRFEGKDMFYINDQNGWAVGNGYIPYESSGSVIIGTTDGGKNWDFVWYKKSDEGMPYLNSIYFVNENTGWAVGDEGLIVKYTSQNHWQEKGKITLLPLNDVFFIDENIGFISGGYLNSQEYRSVFFKTTNGGETWEEIPAFPYLINDIYFHDQRQGWAVGSNNVYSGVILKTEDGGDHWIVQMDNLLGCLYSLHYCDNYLWASGAYGMILRTPVENPDWINKQNNISKSSEYQLYQSYPNPFNPITNIEFRISNSEFVTLRVYNLLGQEMATLVSDKLTPGIYTYTWDASRFNGGVYFYRLHTGEFEQTKKLILMK